MKKFFVQLAASAAVMCAAFSGAMTANATTINDVVAVARQYGYPEELIQQGINMYYAEPDKYTSEHFDTAIASIINGGDTIIRDYFPEYYNPPATTTAPQGSSGGAQTTTTTTVNTQGGSTGGGASQGGTSGGTASFDRISKEEFINMTYEQKKAYISGLSSEQAKEFMSSLSPEEYKSMMSQLPDDLKLQVVDDMAQASESLGMNITVDEFTGDDISLSVRDDDGTLVGVAAAGIVVEDTGYDYRMLFSISGALIVAALGGLVFVARRCFGKKEIGTENEQ